jgi:PAS domain S-box-containing protein
MDMNPSHLMPNHGPDGVGDQERDQWREVVLENALDAVIGVTSDDIVVDWNRQAELTFGWSKAEAIGKRMAELIVPVAYRLRHSDGMAHYMRTGEGPILNRRIEIQASRRNGEFIPVELTVIPILVDGQRLFYSFLRDISARQAAQRRLDSQFAISNLLASAETVDEAISKTLEEIGQAFGWEIGNYWQVDADDKYLDIRASWAVSDANHIQKFAELSRSIRFGRGEGMPGSIWETGEPVWREINPEDKLHMPRAQCALEAGFKSALWFPLKRRSKSVSVRTLGIFEFTGKLIHARDEDIMRAIEATSYQLAQFIDRMEAKESAEKAARESQAVNRVKDEFLASLSHELRTPLTAILGFSEVLRDEFDSLTNTEKMDCIDGIFRNATAQTEMISDLLDVSRIITGKVAFKPDHVSITSVAKNVVDNFASTAEAKQIQLSLKIAQVPATIYADSVRIQQILWNLVANAIKFTPTGGTIELSVYTEDQHCVIDVKDSGAGIEPEFLPYVFDRFRQEDASITRKFGGLGLGLSISRHLAEIHGGTMRAFSEGKGHGSTFRVSLPLRTDAAADLAPAKLAEAPVPASSLLRDAKSLEGVRILLVEDSADSRHLICRLLVKAGAKVLEAESASAAREILKSENDLPDIIVSDIGMPNESGLEFMTSLRETADEKTRGIPSVALTAYVRSEEKDGIMKAGFGAHVAKPVSRDALLAAIHQLLKPN